jgi:hypothetical protein
MTIDLRKPLLAGLLWLLCAFVTPAWGQTHADKSHTIVPGVAPVPNQATGAYSSVTVGTSDSTILAASTAFYFLDLVNASATATICVNFGATATISGTQCAAGEIALPPLWQRSWEGSFVPTDAVHAIASAASTPAAVGAN